MAIRIRKIKGVVIALCAVETDPEPGDIYLNDAIHHALTVKFTEDFRSMGFGTLPTTDRIVVDLMDSQKKRDAITELNAAIKAWMKSPIAP